MNRWHSQTACRTLRWLPLFLLAFTWRPAFSQCSCPGTPASTDPPRQGGDGSPLYWESSETLVLPKGHDSPALYCFKREVQNNSDRAVTDIFWKIAGFEKDVILPHKPGCDATQYLGEEKPLPTGPLYYNVSPQSYHTSVYAPEGGFDGAHRGRDRQDTAELASIIGVASKYSGISGSVMLRSSVKRAEQQNEFAYEVTGSGDEKYLVYWYVPLTPEFKELNMSRKTPVIAEPGLVVHRIARSPDPVGWALATVQIFDADHRWLATGIASVYCSLKGTPEPLLEQPKPRQ